MDQEIKFNYFYDMFNQECRNNIIKNMKNKISESDDDFELFCLFPEQSIGEREKLDIYQDSLFECCANYISLTNTDIVVYPHEALDFVELILNTIEETPYTYSESFVISLQFIYQKFFLALSLGSPLLWSFEDDSNDSYLEVTLDSSNKLVQFESANMTPLQQTKTMTKILKMELEGKVGPFLDVKYCYRKDI